ncbi:hypothetical protein FQZ97_579390 [compost metagenome]
MPAKSRASKADGYLVAAGGGAWSFNRRLCRGKPGCDWIYAGPGNRRRTECLFLLVPLGASGPGGTNGSGELVWLGPGA